MQILPEGVRVTARRTNRRGSPPQPSRRWIRSVKPDWRWSGLLTRAQVVRNHPDPPITDQCPQRPRERILNPSTQVTVGSSPTWSSNSKDVLPKSGVQGRFRSRVAETTTFSRTQLVTGLDCRSSCGEFDSRRERHFQPGVFSGQSCRADQSRSWSQMGRLAAHNGHTTVFDSPQDYLRTTSGILL